MFSHGYSHMKRGHGVSGRFRVESVNVAFTPLDALNAFLAVARRRSFATYLPFFVFGPSR
jgi:alpha-beta hydrolase superfamily lysophospholipase